MSDRNYMYLGGRVGGGAAIFKKNRDTFVTEWYASFNKLSNINAITTKNKNSLLVCGDYLTQEDADPTSGEYQAAVGILEYSGALTSYFTIHGNNPGNGNNQDKCMGIA